MGFRLILRGLAAIAKYLTRPHSKSDDVSVLPSREKDTRRLARLIGANPFGLGTIKREF